MSLFAAKIHDFLDRINSASAELALMLGKAFGAPQADHRAVLVPVREERPPHQPR